MSNYLQSIIDIIERSNHRRVFINLSKKDLDKDDMKELLMILQKYELSMRGDRIYETK